MFNLFTRSRLLLLLTCMVFLNSCINYKKVPYFQDIPQQGESEDSIRNYTPLKIHPFDVLTITVTSLNPEASALFNAPVTQHTITTSNTAINVNTVQNGNNNNVANQQTGLLVDEQGNLNLPYIGTVHVEGLTTTEARAMISKRLETYLKEPLVNVRIANFKVGVFGDVNTPGFVTVPTERMTLMEALFLAGDLKVSAIRDNVLLIREIDGKRKFVRFNLNSKSTFTSPYYYLKTNDLVYVQSALARDKKDSVLSNIGSATSLFSLILLLLRL